ncbi:MAG: DUF4835 family protein [Rhodothermales bacterium]
MTRFLVRAGVLLACACMYVASAPSDVQAQEFNCTVSVNYSSLSGSDFGFLSDLEDRIEEYVNKRSWTEDRFRENERIECTMQVTVEEAISLTSFRARLIIASRRPIYNTTQHTTVVQFNDTEWQFNYAQGQPLVFNLDQYDPLVSIIDFYAYVMLGYDYDTFSEYGGSDHFATARRIAERAQSQSAPGWSQVGSDRGRVNLITQILDPRLRPLRKAYFDYHFGGLDRFTTETDAARATMLEVLVSLDELFQDVSRQYAIDLFFSAKYTEFPSVFDGWQRSSEAYDHLTRLDPSHISTYEELVN